MTISCLPSHLLWKKARTIDFARQFPERFFDVAIAEQHAVTLAACMATQASNRLWRFISMFLNVVMIS